MRLARDRPPPLLRTELRQGMDGEEPCGAEEARGRPSQKTLPGVDEATRHRRPQWVLRVGSRELRDAVRNLGAPDEVQRPLPPD